MVNLSKLKFISACFYKKFWTTYRRLFIIEKPQVGFHKNILTQIFENCVLFNLQKIMCISISNGSLSLICYTYPNHIQRLNEIAMYLSPFCLRFFLNFIFLMCPQIVSNWNLNSFLVGKVWRSERRRWDGLSPHWSHKSRQQGTFWSSCQYMH